MKIYENESGKIDKTFNDAGDWMLKNGPLESTFRRLMANLPTLEDSATGGQCSCRV